MLCGANGSGKTTLLRCINFLETADSGLITVDGDVIFDGENYAHCSNFKEGLSVIEFFISK